MTMSTFGNSKGAIPATSYTQRLEGECLKWQQRAMTLQAANEALRSSHAELLAVVEECQKEWAQTWEVPVGPVLVGEELSPPDEEAAKWEAEEKRLARLDARIAAALSRGRAVQAGA